MSLLDNMNPMQREAILNTKGPSLILAGAGSGKTRVLTHKIAYLIKEEGISPYNILALTFTNKAAQEMKHRIEKLVDVDVKSMWTGTFHSICVRMLRRYIDRIGYDSSFVIFDTQDQKTVVKDCIKELELNDKIFDVNSMLYFISGQKDRLVKPEDFLKSNEAADFREKQKGEIYKLYQKKLKQNNALDFDDLIVKTIDLLRENEDVLNYYSEKFEYILVDEYQDTNRAQYLFVSLLAKKHGNICVVGDSDQSIYGWRGADIRNILDFEKDYPDAKIIKLEQNYRSTKTILDAANYVIENNYNRKAKSLWTENMDGEKIRTYEANNEHDEANFVVAKIKSSMEKSDMSYRDFAVLYRTNAQSRVMEEALIKSNIPYKIVGGLKFYDRKEIKDIIAYLRLVQNPLDNISLKRIVNVPKRGIGKTTLDKVEKYSLENESSMYSSLYRGLDIGLSQRTVTKINEFLTLIGKFIAMKELLGLKALIENVIETSGYLKELGEEDTIESRTRIENIEEFLSVVIEYETTNPEGTLEDFLADLSLLSDIDKTDEENENTVTLMTLHSSKGLEFPCVFVIGMEEGLFPSYRSLMSESDLEEERRLCYVGITRARDVLFLINAVSRMLYGKTNYNRPSRFLAEIPEDLKESENTKKVTYKQKLEYKKPNTSLFGGVSLKREESKRVDNSELISKAVPGAKVEHKTLGIGTIVEVKQQGNDAQVTIAFSQGGIKKLMLSYAPIKFS